MRLNPLIVLLIPAIFLLSCDPPTTPRQPDGKFVQTDLPPVLVTEPVPLYPINGAMVQTATPTVHWSSGSGGPYEIQIASDSEFTREVLTAATKNTSVTLSLENSGVYWWKIRRAGGTWSSSSSFAWPVPAFAGFRSTVQLYDLPLQLLCKRTRVYAGGEIETKTTIEETLYDVGYFDVFLPHSSGYLYINDYLATNGYHQIVSFTADGVKATIGPIEMRYQYPTSYGATRRVQEARIRFTAELAYSLGKQTVVYTGEEARNCVNILSFRDSSYTKEMDGGHTTLVKTIAESAGASPSTSITVYVYCKR
ncbi:MAG: hypothetical protein WBQ23_09860 [Bacteroidota bacterium]